MIFQELPVFYNKNPAAFQQKKLRFFIKITAPF